MKMNSSGKKLIMITTILICIALMCGALVYGLNMAGINTNNKAGDITDDNKKIQLPTCFHKPPTLYIWWEDYLDSMHFINQVINDFQYTYDTSKYSINGVGITPYTPRAMDRNALEINIAGRTAPNIVKMDQADIVKLAEKGYLEKLSDVKYNVNRHKDIYSKSVWDAIKVGHDIYSLPFDAGTTVMAYDKTGSTAMRLINQRDLPSFNNGNYHLEPPPSLGEGMTTYTQLKLDSLVVLGESTGNRITELSYDFVEFMATKPQYQAEYCTILNLTPTLKEAQQMKPFNEGNYKIFLEQLDASKIKIVAEGLDVSEEDY